jgi:hypothetical protein
MFTGTASSDILVDSVSFKASSIWTPWVHAPTVPVSTTARQLTAHNPLSDPLPNGTMAFSAGWCASAWVWTDWAGNDTTVHVFMQSPETAGLNNKWQMKKYAAGDIAFDLYDGAGALKEYDLVGNATNWTAGGAKYIEACTNNAGTAAFHWYNAANLTWYDGPFVGGVGTGIQSGQSASLYIGHDAGSYPLNGFIQSPTISPYSATWPHAGFNDGVAPKRAY